MQHGLVRSDDYIHSRGQWVWGYTISNLKMLNGWFYRMYVTRTRDETTGFERREKKAHCRLERTVAMRWESRDDKPKKKWKERGTDP